MSLSLQSRLILRPICARALSTTSQRYFTLNLPRLLASTTEPTKVGNVEVPTAGSEGFHYKDDPVNSPRPADEAKAGQFGDWVLFHPVYSDKELQSVKIAFHNPQGFGDKVARAMVTLARKCFDIASGYKNKVLTAEEEKLPLEELRKRGLVLDERGWLARFLFLESIAGVPGMVAATLRHLRSLRLMRRDGGWIHTLLEEAENERMHLMTFMTLRKPSIFFRAMILGAQGVFYNLFFLSYLFNPRICHRFVGCLEEEAVVTYTHCIKELELGRFPEWVGKPAPKIAIDYWRLAPDATMKDVVYAVRSDESTHRFVNHSLANLSVDDGNPFAVREPGMEVKGVKPGFSKEEAESYISQTLAQAQIAQKHEPKSTSLGPASSP